MLPFFKYTIICPVSNKNEARQKHIILTTNKFRKNYKKYYLFFLKVGEEPTNNFNYLAYKQLELHTMRKKQ